MTKHEAKQILKLHNEWRRGAVSVRADPYVIGEAIDVVCQPNELAQSIRDAAINSPAYFGDVECGVLNAFCQWSEWESKLLYGSYDEKVQSLTFMLFVAESLE